MLKQIEYALTTEHRYECHEPAFGKQIPVVIYYNESGIISAVFVDIDDDLHAYNPSMEWIKNKSEEIRRHLDLLPIDDVEALKIDVQLLRKDCKRLRNELDACRGVIR